MSIRPSAPISIHVPREGHDKCRSMSALDAANFNPRAPRGARRRAYAYVAPRLRISIHVPREGHDAAPAACVSLAALFQSTCPARGTTDKLLKEVDAQDNFNPRAPRGARPINLDIAGLAFNISIHVPREGHDIPPGKMFLFPRRFQSTCPARGTTGRFSARSGQLTHFNPRAPRGARPLGSPSIQRRASISIHVPREGHDNSCQ